MGQVHWVWVVFAGLVGLCMGSFLNVVALRLLASENFVWTPSHCPHCQRPLRFWENIPLVSWIALGGKCATCKHSVSVQYLLVELFTAGLFMGVVFCYGLSWESLFYLVLIASLVVITITDLREQYIYDINSLSLIPLGLLFHALHLGHWSVAWAMTIGGATWAISHGLVSALIAVVGVWVVFKLLSLLSRWLVGAEGFGGGDVKLMMGLGAFLGWQQLLWVFVLSFVAQSVVGIPIIVRQWVRNKDKEAIFYASIATVSAVLPYFIGSLKIAPWIELLGMLFFAGLAMFALFRLMRRPMAQDSLTYLPFGPAIVLGALVVLFAGIPLQQWLMQSVWMSLAHASH